MDDLHDRLFAEARHFHDRNPVSQARLDAEPLSADEELQTVRRLAGRVLSRRGHGRLQFMDLEDLSGRIQLLCSQERVSVPEIHVGDLVGVSGHPARSRSGEPSLNVDSFELLSPSLVPLPDHVHGFEDVESRYRRRALDLIMNASTREIFLTRSRLLSALRRRLDEDGFAEVETPILQPRYGGAHASPFTTHSNALDSDMYLRVAPELYLRRLIVGGLERVYEIGRNFRNEGLSYRHNPEFTMLEWYEAYADYEDTMRRVEELLTTVALDAHNSSELSFRGHDISFRAPFARLSVVDALEREGLWTRERDQLATRLSARGVEFAPQASWGELVEEALSSVVEPQLIQPTFLYGHPVELSPLARRSEADPTLTDRFELLVGGMELGNGYSEINDAREQEARFLGAGLSPDEDFLSAQALGMPPTGGVGIGIDRLAMLLCGADSIREVILFPALREQR